MEKSPRSPRSQPHLTEDERMELTNIAIELHALCRIFDHAACDRSGENEGDTNAYSDVSSLLRPLCKRLDRLRETVGGH